jgi:hypothetical protein
MRRIVMLLTVVALMVVMLAMSVAPAAFAARYGDRSPVYNASGHAWCAYAQQDYWAQTCH